MNRLGILTRSRAIIFNCVTNSIFKESKVTISPLHCLEIQRNTSFFNKLTAKDLWRGVLSVSNAGKRKGRGKGGDQRVAKNLNFGKRIGVGEENVVWPGLTTPIIQSNTLIEIQKLPKVDKPVVQVPTLTRKRAKLHPLERGWTGKNICGRNLGPPEPENGVSYPDFNCVVVEHKILMPMTSLFGRRRIFSSFVLTGNGKGLIGCGKAFGLEQKTAIRKAQIKAIKRLISFNFSNDYSVNHDFFCQFRSTKIFVYKKPQGYGLICHRALKTCCELIGIKNMAAKVEGNTSNIQNLIKAFFIGLMQQKSPQEMANETKLNVVEISENREYFPRLLASPEKCLTTKEKNDANINFESYIWGGRTVLRTHLDPERLLARPEWQRHLKKSIYTRNFKETEIDLRVEYGEKASYLVEKYPECRQITSFKKRKQEGEE